MREGHSFKPKLCPISCRFRSGDDEFEGLIASLSLSGALIIDAEFLPSAGVIIELRIPDGDNTLFLGARVIFGRSSSFGVKFLNLTEDLVQRLMPFFQDQSEGDGAPSSQTR